MEIEDTRSATPDRFSIEDLRVGYDWDTDTERKWVSRYLLIYLKPEGYLRDRFASGGSSYETKKHGARRIKLNADEIAQIMDALKNEVEICHQVLLEKGLIPELAEARRQAAEKSKLEPK